MPFDDVLANLQPLKGEELEAARRRFAELCSSSSSGIAGSYQGLVFEHPVPYDQAGENKVLFIYNQSLERVKAAGFQRHPRPVEAFGLLAESLEGKLTGDLKEVADNMLQSHGEWLSLAVERRGDVLIAQVDPEGLAWKKDEYVKTKKFACTEQREFDVTGKPSGSWIDLKEFNEDFVRFMYGRRFEDLPVAMREGDKRARVALPSEGKVRPVGRVVFYRFYVYYYDVASRGVRERA